MTDNCLLVTLISDDVVTADQKPRPNPNDESQPVFAALNKALARLRAADLPATCSCNEQWLNELIAGEGRVRVTNVARAQRCRSSTMQHCATPLSRLDKRYYLWVEGTFCIPFS